MLFVFLVIVHLGILRRQFQHRKRSLIWAGMARESAHQLGTPISSLHGWLELLKIKLYEARALRGSVDLETVDEIDGQEKEILDGIAQDIERLSKVANRFELIGRQQQLRPPGPLPRFSTGTEQLFSRAPAQARQDTIELQVEIEELPPVRGNPTLLEWAFENLIKNSYRCTHRPRRHDLVSRPCTMIERT